ncbi:NADPH dehydrogenase [Roseimaritima multifibrata]|uniref:NADPH dehydrogenase n=1 Tax=Roseimaritima multifibrata TaxID=1930274 RepID=A0A517MHT3_9BACT|nr:NADH:flavin oxidoreductase/NADH oxidase [Roseimaritima multifibrata]QDS94438.1 NADPH dehydrogenase [Roseimaritima multifibrata]
MSRLFQPLTIKDVTLRNRIAVSPMCQYASEDGLLNDWHLVHLGSRAVGGAGLVMVEATAVSPEGRISPADSGFWEDKHIQTLSKITRFMGEHGAVAGIQLAHAGRKASCRKPWEGDDSLDSDQGGWETVAPSAIAFGNNIPKVPKALLVDQIQHLQNDFVDAAKRALEAGFQVLQLHFAHGYLAHEFYSPLSNQRTDQYGGSFENRIRFLTETFAAVREVWPERLPLTVRLSVTDWVEGGVTIEESIELVQRLKAGGLDMLDVSHGFVTPDIDSVPWGPGMMLPIAKRIREEADLPTTTSWMISEPIQAEQAVASGQVDVVSLGRELLRDPYWPFHAAKELKAEAAKDLLPLQYARAVE